MGFFTDLFTSDKPETAKKTVKKKTKKVKTKVKAKTKKKIKKRTKKRKKQFQLIFPFTGEDGEAMLILSILPER